MGSSITMTVPIATAVTSPGLRVSLLPAFVSSRILVGDDDGVGTVVEVRRAPEPISVPCTVIGWSTPFANVMLVLGVKRGGSKEFAVVVESDSLRLPVEVGRLFLDAELARG